MGNGNWDTSQEGIAAQYRGGFFPNSTKRWNSQSTQ